MGKYLDKLFVEFPKKTCFDNHKNNKGMSIFKIVNINSSFKIIILFFCLVINQLKSFKEACGDICDEMKTIKNK